MENDQNEPNEMKAAKSLNFNDKIYPGVLEATNKLAYELQRKPHDVIAFLLPKISKQLPEILNVLGINQAG